MGSPCALVASGPPAPKGR